MIRLLLLALLPSISLAASPPPVAAKSWAILDFETGQLLDGRNADGRVYPASLTKLMTAYVAFDALKKGTLTLDEKIKVSVRAWRRGYVTRESRMFLDVGSQVAVADLLRGIIIQSGNDASVALAERLSGSEKAFAVLMNQHAQTLGLKNSRFSNATGVPDAGLYTTARDMARLSQALIRDFPQHYGLFSEREFTYNGIWQRNRNALLAGDFGVDGLKTGHHDAAGYCLAASAVRNGRRLITVVMGSKTPTLRTGATKALLNYGYGHFETITAVAAAQPLTRARLWQGRETEAALGVATPVTVSVRRGAKPVIELKPQVHEPLVAPVNAGQIAGEMQVWVDGRLVQRVPLQVLNDHAPGNLWQRFSDGARLKWAELQ